MKTGYSFGSLVSFVEALNAAAVKITGDQTIAGLKTFSSNPITSAAQGSGGGYLTRKDYVDDALALKAPLASPTLTGTPTAPTATAGTNTTQIATTAFVQNTAASAVTAKASSTAPLMDGVATSGTSTNYAREGHIHPTDTSRAPLASPALTGTPTAPTQTAGDNSTRIATTAFVQAAKETARTTTYIVANEAGMLALANAKKGDLAIRSDINNRTFILYAEPYSSLSNWRVLAENVFISDFAKTLLDDVDAAAMRDTLGISELEPRVSDNEAKVFEALRRSYADAGYLLVNGSFEKGGTLTAATDVLLYEANGKAYSGPTGAVAAGSTPSAAYTDRSADLLRNFVNQELAKTNSQVETIAPSLPGVTNDNKFFMSWGEAGVRGYIVSRTKNGFYSAVALTNEVSPADAQNTGGASNIRPGKVLKCSALKLAKTKAYSKTSGVVVSSLTPAQIKSVWGYAPTSLFQVVANTVADFNWTNPNVYSVPYSSSADESITYKVSAGRSATVIFGVSGGSSNNVLIETSFDGVAFTKYQDVDTSGGISGSVLRKEVDVVTGAQNPWYIRITNKTTALGSFAYVAGLNIMDLPREGIWDFDSVILQIIGGVSTDLSYQMVNGANEFAALESTTGKWFGTYHGGHSDFIDRLRIDNGGSVNIREELPSFAYMSSSFELYSQSTLTSSGGVACNYSAITQFGDGCHITTYAFKPISQPSIRCSRVFTHMCTTSPNFERVILPTYVIKEDDGLVLIGNVQHCKQDRAFDVASVRCWWSGVRSAQNAYGGGYISFLPNYNKQYYGPIVDTSGDFFGGMFVTAKEYL